VPNRQSQERAVRVLIADDSAAFLRAAVEVVTLADGFEVVGVADSGAAAIEQVVELEPDFVLLDVRMPDVGGVEAARRIAEVRPETVVVLISDWSVDDVSTPGVRGRTKACGAVAAIRKQCLLPSLVQTLWQAHGASR
jgi:DNA-binding NarL/FixJ family response regulator